jgi:hypothetical protein
VLKPHGLGILILSQLCIFLCPDIRILSVKKCWVILKNGFLEKAEKQAWAQSGHNLGTSKKNLIFGGF